MYAITINIMETNVNFVDDVMLLFIVSVYAITQVGMQQC